MSVNNQEHKSHFIRATILDSLTAAHPYGMTMRHVFEGMSAVSGSIFILQSEITNEVDWMLGKELIEVIDIAGLSGDDARRLKLSPKGITFCNKKKPWDRLEELS